MAEAFEIQKNKRAALLTFGICMIVALIAILYKWRIHVPVINQQLDLIEVNLGNEKEGLGNTQPLVKGAPAPERKDRNNESEKVKATAAASKSIDADKDDDPNAAPVTKANKTKGTSGEATVVAPKKPKVPIYQGGKGPGGNAPTDNGFRNEGYKPGKGDQGSAGGKPDSYGNTPGGNSGVSVVRGLSNRKPIHFPSMQDEFNETAKVYVDIVVDEAGKVTSASIAKGTTTTSSSLRSIAVQKAKQLKFPASSAETESGTILFNFILRN